jgi:hypothetical protein
VRMLCRLLVGVGPHVEVRVRDAPFNFAVGAAIAVLDLVMSKENIPYNLYVILVLVYVSFPFSFICI